MTGASTLPGLALPAAPPAKAAAAPPGGRPELVKRRHADDGLYYFSASKLSSVLVCNLKAHRRYVEGLPDVDGLPGFRGTQVHEGLELTRGASHNDAGVSAVDLVDQAWRRNAPEPWRDIFMRWLGVREETAEVDAELDRLAEEIRTDAVEGRRKGGAQAPRMTGDWKKRAEQLLAPWADTLEALEAEERQLLDGPDSPWQATKRSGFEDYASSLATTRAYMAWWDAMPEERRPEVLSAEGKFRMPLNNRFLLAGKIDRIDIAPDLGDATVVLDYKTGQARDPEERAIQAMVYAEGAEMIAGERPEYVRFLNLDLGPDHPRYVETYPVKASWAFTLLGMLELGKKLLEGPPVPTFHGCHFCPYTGMCFDPETGSNPFTTLESLAQTITPLEAA